jgi:hypothetical protein
VETGFILSVILRSPFGTRTPFPHLDFGSGSVKFVGFCMMIELIIGARYRHYISVDYPT